MTCAMKLSSVDEVAQIAVQVDRRWSEQNFLGSGQLCSQACLASEAKLSTN